MDLKNFDYNLPQEFIAKKPASPRDSSRLFIYDTVKDEIIFDRFYNLDKYLPKNSFLVLNKTRVSPARLTLFKETGGRVEILLLLNELQADDKIIKGLSDRKLVPGQKLFFERGAVNGNLSGCANCGKPAFFVAAQDKNIFSFRPNFPIKNLSEILKKYGKTPIPKYIKNSPLAEKDLRKKYQTVFAARLPQGSHNSAENLQSSVAAPTASLHFTSRVFKKLQRQKIPHVFITLNVGLGTFAPIAEGNFKNKKLFTEHYEIEKPAAQKIAELKNAGRKLVAVGTTTVRTLESACQLRIAGEASKRQSNLNCGATDLFIFPPYNFRAVDHLITNFHLPQSSLMLLVEAFLQHKNSRRDLTDLYKIAIKNKFRFYSFGDAMLIL